MSEWISVEASMPESSDPVLACDKYGDIEIGLLYTDAAGNRRWASHHGDLACLCGVTHWMPLPPPAEGE